MCVCVFKDFIYLFLDRGEGKEKERERNINVWLPLICPQLRTWPAIQACALTGNQTHDLCADQHSTHWATLVRALTYETLKGWILWSVSYISIKHFFDLREKKQL